jgi:hypothetical protein
MFICTHSSSFIAVMCHFNERACALLYVNNADLPSPDFAHYVLFKLFNFSYTLCHTLQFISTLYVTLFNLFLHSMSHSSIYFYTLCHTLQFISTLCHTLQFIFTLYVTLFNLFLHSMSHSSIFLCTLCMSSCIVLDFRLMEAMASGALILVDRMSVPRPYALIEGTHIVYYGESNSTLIFRIFYLAFYFLPYPYFLFSTPHVYYITVIACPLLHDISLLILHSPQCFPFLRIKCNLQTITTKQTCSRSLTSTVRI